MHYKSNTPHETPMTDPLKTHYCFSYEGAAEISPWGALTLQHEDGQPLSLEPFVTTCLDRVLSALLKDHPVARQGCYEVSLLLTDAATMRTLNRDHRGQDKPTNVLSFGYVSAPMALEVPREEEGTAPPVLLGDLVFSFETIEDEARAQKKSFQNHFTHLLVHGLLHLLGYDHEDDDEAAQMEDLERVLLKGFGIPDPYRAPKDDKDDQPENEGEKH